MGGGSDLDGILLGGVGGDLTGIAVGGVGVGVGGDLSGIAIGGIGVGGGGELKRLLVDRASPALAYFKVHEGSTRASKVDRARVIEY